MEPYDTGRGRHPEEGRPRHADGADAAAGGALGRFGAAVDPVALVDYSRGKFTRRMEVLTDEGAAVPDIETLVDLDAQDSTAAD